MTKRKGGAQLCVTPHAPVHIPLDLEAPNGGVVHVDGLKDVGVADRIGATQEFLVHYQLLEVASKCGDIQAQTLDPTAQPQLDVLAGLGLEIGVGQKPGIDAGRRINETIELGRVGSAESTGVIAVGAPLRCHPKQRTKLGRSVDGRNGNTRGGSGWRVAVLADHIHCNTLEPETWCDSPAVLG